MDRIASYQLGPASGEADGADTMTREKSHHTLADLKRQRAAAKVNKYPGPLPVEEELSVSANDSTPVTDEQSSPSQVYFTAASGDPPLLKLRAPEEEQSNTKEPCCGLM